MHQSIHKIMNIREILKKYWGYDSFRPLQEDIINSVIEGHDTLGLLPTGGGKSITFQVPGLFFNHGVTVVVSPLISLMKDQVDNLRRRRIKAVFFHAGMSTSESRIAWDTLINGKARFLYISPERLSNDRFMLELRGIDVNLIVVDEAHCISQWGYDFRPSYLNIKSLRKLKPDVPVLALTATATPEVEQDIREQLEFRDHNTFRKSFVRDNISFIVRPSEAKIHETLHILSRTSGSAIVYVRSRKRCRDISDFLNSADIPSTYYHAGLDFKVKESRQNEWQSGIVRVMVATNAFGMGIDKPDVRVVIHYDFPPSLEEYYQEAGRAGRDSLHSYAVLLSSKTDAAKLHRNLTEAFPPRDVVKKIYERICIFLHLSVGEGYDSLNRFDILKFCKTFKIQEKQCRASLRLLSHAGYMHFIEDPDSRSRLKVSVGREDLYDIHDLSPKADAVLSKALRMYPGLFSDYVYIWEPEIASLLNMPENDVYESMLELSRHKIVSYIPHSDIPMIYMPTAREETSALLIGKIVYEQRRDSMSGRIEAMLGYASAKGNCRVRMMLGYFGENTASDCGQCDVCRAARSAGRNKSIERQNCVQTVFSVLSGHPDGLTLQMIERLCGPDTRATADAVAFLCAENFIECENNIYRVS